MTLQGVMTPYRSRRGSDTLRLADEKTATARRRALMIDCPFGGCHVSNKTVEIFVRATVRNRGA